MSAPRQLALTSFVVSLPAASEAPAYFSPIVLGKCICGKQHTTEGHRRRGQLRQPSACIIVSADILPLILFFFSPDEEMGRKTGLFCPAAVKTVDVNVHQWLQSPSVSRLNTSRGHEALNRTLSGTGHGKTETSRKSKRCGKIKT